MSNELSSVKSSINEMEAKSKLMTQRSLSFNHAGAELSRTISKMKECHELLDKKSSFEGQYASDKENISKRQQHSDEIIQRELQMRRQLSSQQDKIDKLNLQQSQKRTVIEDSLQSLREEYENVTRDRLAVQEKITANERLIKETEAQVILNVHL